jgi:hypothetical protein
MVISLNYHEAKSILKNVYNLQEKFKNANNKYSRDLDILGFINHSPNYSLTFNNKYYEKEKGFGRARELPTKYINCFSVKYYNAFAVSNLDGDTFLDIWSIDSDGKIIQIQSDYKNKILEFPSECLDKSLKDK